MTMQKERKLYNQLSLEKDDMYALPGDTIHAKQLLGPYRTTEHDE